MTGGDDPRRTGAADTPAESAVDPSTPLFRVRSFRLIFTTRMTSNMANQMLAVAVGWQVYELTHSSFLVGLLGTVQLVPVVLFGLIGGSVADSLRVRNFEPSSFNNASGIS